VDNLNHVAFGVKDSGRRGKPGIAVARFIRLEEQSRTVEFAITVIDEYQHRGLGTLLLEILMKLLRIAASKISAVFSRMTIWP